MIWSGGNGSDLAVTIRGDGAVDTELLIPLMDTLMDSRQGGQHGLAPTNQDFNFEMCTF